MFQIVAHMSYHVAGGGCSLRNFSDLCLLNQKLKPDNRELYAMLEQCGIKQFYDECLKLTDAWFVSGKHDETTLLFQQYLLAGGIYGIKKNQVAFKRSKQSKLSYVFERIFMPYEQLLVKYPSLKGKHYLVPFYQIRRWCRLIFKGRIAYSKQEFSVNEEISAKKIEDVSELFRRLGIG